MQNLQFGIRVRLDGQGQASAEVRQLGADFKSLGASADGSAAGANRLAASLQRIGQIGAGLVAFEGVRRLAGEAIAAADAMSNLSSRLRLVTEGSAELAAAGCHPTA